MVVDAHVHIFRELRCAASSPLLSFAPVYGPTGNLTELHSAGTDHGTHAAKASVRPFQYTAEMLLADMEAAGVDQAVLLQAPAYGEQNDCTLAAAERYPGKFIAAAYLDPWNKELWPALKSGLHSGDFSAAKIEFSDNFGLCSMHPDARLDAPDLQSLWRALIRRNRVLVLDLGAIGGRSYQTAAVREIAESNPKLRIVICHLAKPTPSAEADPGLWRMWRDQIALGRLSNVWFDTAAMPDLDPQGAYPYPEVARYLRIAVDLIGPEKILWGTDFPTLIQYATYPQLLEIAHQHTSFLSSAEQRMFLGENALRVYQPRLANDAELSYRPPGPEAAD